MYCLYCDQDISSDEFSDEHIWPQALGGDILPTDIWRIDVCEKCNSMSGVFVDGAFIKGWSVQNQRVNLNSSKNESGLQFAYIGRVDNLGAPQGEIVDYYTSKRASVLVIRPEESEDLWKSYVGGNPKRKKLANYRAYLIFNIADQSQHKTVYDGFRKQFDRYQRFIATPMNISDKVIDHIDHPNHPYPQDRAIRDAYFKTSNNGEKISGQIVMDLDYGMRFACKLALALGYKLIGEQFIGSNDCNLLRRGFREANFQKRQTLPIRGTSFYSNENQELSEVFRIENCWSLVFMVVEEQANLSIISPIGNSITIRITDEAGLVENIEAEYGEGWVWIVNPFSEEAASISVPDFIAHKCGVKNIVEITEISAS